ncbi:MAG: FAD-dependent thymidylate synthase [Dehalococcoidia bacterium]|nr:MAG: FAD-dependent thymidylate synthase [Dehalococcoidia bacterium]
MAGSTHASDDAPRLTPEQRAEVDTLRAECTSTRRATVAALEEILYEPLPVLDHGLVRVIDYMGDDAAVVQAARVSYGRGTRRQRDDQGLINYLMRNWHTSPFEMCEIKLHVKLPIFVARQWIRHRTANVNEYSARYSILDNEFYIPDAANIAVQSSTNRQGRGETLGAQQARRVQAILREDAERAYANYDALLNEGPDGAPRDPSYDGVARELARMNLSLNFYTQWYWKTDLHNLMHFVRLRADAHAQYEIRVYADILSDVMARWVPMTHRAFVNYRQGGAQLSQQSLEAVRRMLAGEKLTAKAAGMSPGEWRELQALLAGGAQQIGGGVPEPEGDA